MHSLDTVYSTVLVLLILQSAETAESNTPTATRSDLRERVAIELNDQKAEWSTGEQKLRRQLGQFLGTWAAMNGRIFYSTLAIEYPEEWFAATQIERPLLKRKLLPVDVHDLETVSAPVNSLTIMITYPAAEHLAKEDFKARRLLLEQPITKSFFGDPEPDFRCDVWYMRSSSMDSTVPRATACIRCRVRQEQTGRLFDLVATEAYVYVPTAEAGKACWQLGDARHVCFPISGKEKLSAHPGKHEGE